MTEFHSPELAHPGSGEPGIPLAADQPAGTVILVRHGRPALAWSGRLDARGWDGWWAAYNRSGLAEGQVPPDGLIEVTENARLRFSSPLPRAVQTARALFGPAPFRVDPVFVEAPLPAPRWPSWVRLSPTFWGIVTRLAWLAGYAGQGESYSMARARARLAAERLSQATLECKGGPVVLCAHGWFNRMIQGALGTQGWICTYNGGNRYWSWRVLRAPKG